MSENVGERLYEHTAETHNMAAARAVLPKIAHLVEPRSVLDVGTGLGTWLAGWAELGVEDLLGVDGSYVDRSLLTIPESMFMARDLREPLDLGRRFDLVMSLEVAEHLPERLASTFVESLVRHGDSVLFAAAVPGQGGQGHLNEQWPRYWQDLFAPHGFEFRDVVRPLIWDDNNIEVWYRQNTFLVQRATEQVRIDALDRIHPALWEQRVRRLTKLEATLIVRLNRRAKASKAGKALARARRMRSEIE